MSEPSSESGQVIEAAQGTHWQWEADGDMVVVWRGDVDLSSIEPTDWREQFREFLGSSAVVSLVGAKRLTDKEGQDYVFSMGEFVVHPKGFHHLGKGVHGKCYRFPVEVDCVAGGVMAIKKEVFERIDGEGLLEGALSGVNLGLAVRQDSGRCFVVPRVVVKDDKTVGAGQAESENFRERWGFDWLMCDLDAAKEAHHGDGIIWNMNVYAGGLPFEKYDERGAMHWVSYQQSDPFRQRADKLSEIAAEVTGAGGNGLCVDLGCGDGLYSHLAAKRGVKVLGVDPEENGIKQSQEMTVKQDYPQDAPRFELGVGETLPVGDGEASAVMMLDVIEHLPNPIVVLREAARALGQGGHLLVVTPAWQYGGSSDPVYHNFEYTQEELVRQMNAIGGIEVVNTGKIGGVYRDLVVIGRKS
ncbi:class I SAM-dependent methyltransferase [Poriferisphaera sp. WC338]|uniref:class I SAM-dependent methyltransferase n=1 Tax=Poriferisphaera sp. WC338 TaxID=3425129 RepID=UPI003D8148CB